MHGRRSHREPWCVGGPWRSCHRPTLLPSPMTSELCRLMRVPLAAAEWHADRALDATEWHKNRHMRSCQEMSCTRRHRVAQPSLARPAPGRRYDETPGLAGEGVRDACLPATATMATVPRAYARCDHCGALPPAPRAWMGPDVSVA